MLASPPRAPILTPTLIPLPPSNNRCFDLSSRENKGRPGESCSPEKNNRSFNQELPYTPVMFTPGGGGGMMDEPIHLIARYAYSATESSELSIKKGEKLILVDGQGDWWKVKNAANKVGKVPSNYVEKKVNTKKPQKSQSFFKKLLGGKERKGSTETNGAQMGYIDSFPNFDPNTGSGYTMSQNPVSFGSPHSPQGGVGANGSFSSPSGAETAVAIYNYQAKQADELDLSKGDNVTVIQKSCDGWWQVHCNGRTGWIPSNYLNVNSGQQFSANQQAENGSKTVQDSSISQNNGVSTNGENTEGPFLFGVIALYKFEAQDLNELSFQKDERLDIIGEPTSDQDWWEARNSQGSMGLVPKKYVKEVPGATPVFKPTLRRPTSCGSGGASSSISPRNPGGSLGTHRAEYVNKSGDGPYKDREWYYGRITRNACEQLFEEFGQCGDYLVRESESCPGDYSVSLKASPKNRHFHVQLQPADGQLLIGSKTFPNLDQLIEHYKLSPIYTDATGTRLFLIKPLIA